MYILEDLGISILGRFVPYYGLCIVAGIVVGALVAHQQARVHRLAFDDMILFTCFAALGGIVGAKLLFLLVSWEHIEWSRLVNPTYLSSIMNSGFVFYGGVIGAVIACCVARRFINLEWRILMNVLAPAFAVGHGFGRIGCLLVGCCYGIPWDGIVSVTYNHSIIAPNGIPLVPVQLIEAIGEGIIALILIWMINYRNKSNEGILLYLVLYTPLRFILEFLRYDDIERGMLGMFSTSQWISIALFIIACIYLVWSCTHSHFSSGVFMHHSSKQ